ncbi:hypothetical protein O5D80_001153 [Batrachochytrium dendrobatidis]|nr:hypothetical protein O5D80_001153 [Batrachochytrium dendrobatidis]
MSIHGRLDQLSQYISTENNQPSLSLEVLLDAFLAVYTDCKSANNTSEQISGFIRQYDQLVPKLQTLRVNTRDFETIKTLATGAVGRVCLVRAKKDSKVYAMKILKKSDLLTRREAAFFMEERNALVFSEQSKWITTLYAAFQDEDNLYLVMEYVSGGSLRSLLNNKETSMEENEARFYIAEMILALEVLHKYSYIHRDVKPENCLIDSAGHIKLADFGSCIRLSDAARVTSHETVGTPDYISPEILQAHEGNANYNQSVDWWSLGVILYELLFDEVPFYSESLVETYGKIMNHKKYFAFPDDIEISDTCKNFIQGLICASEERLGKNGIDEIKSHPWFAGIPWSDLRDSTAPFVPELSGPEDTRYFEDEENESKKFAKKTLARNREFSGQNLAFVGYTYVKNATALISWPGLDPQTANSGSNSLLSIKEKAYSTGASNFTVNNAAYDALKEQLDKEAQKSLALSTSKKQSEDELASLRAAQARDVAQRAELQNTLGIIEKERHRLEAEFKQLKLVHDRDAHDRSELEERIGQLRESLERETRNNADTQELTEIRKKLERDISTLTISLKDEKAQAVKREVSILELSKEKLALDKEVSRLAEALKEERQLKQDAVVNSEELAKQVDSAIATVHSLEYKISLLEQEVLRQSNMITSLKGTLELEMEKTQTSNARIADLEKQNAFFQIEVDSQKSQLEESQLREAELRSIAHELQSTSKATATQEIDGLRAQLSQQTTARTKAADELSQLTKNKALLEIEYTDIKTKYASEVQSHAETQRSFKELQGSVHERSRYIITLEDARKNAYAQAGATVFNSAAMSAQISLLQKQIKSLEEINTGLHQSNDSVRTELSIVSLELQNSLQSNEKLQLKISELESTCSIELKSRINIDSQRNVLQLLNTQLVQESERLRSRIDVITQEHDNTITEHHSTIMQLRAEFKNLEEKLAAEREKGYQLEDSHATMNRWVHELEEDAKRETEIRTQTDKLLKVANKRLCDIGVELEAGIDREQQLHFRISELESACEALKYKLEAADEKEREIQLSTDTRLRVDEKSHSRFKLRGIFFKGSRDGVDLNVDRTTQKLQDIDDDAKNTKDADHRRKQSSQSMDSLSSSLKLQTPLGAKISELTTLDFFNPAEILQGWLKVPKGGKVKKGWKLQYAVVRNLKIFMYERDQDVDVLPGIELIDITSDIFLAKAVSQNEVIHANGRDIDLIFKIQAWSSDGSTNPETETFEIQHRIQKIQIDIQLEEKMQQAAEKILSVTTDAQKVTVISQIDSSNKRLRALKGELEKLTPAVNKGVEVISESMSSSKESLENASIVSEYGNQKQSDELFALRKEFEAQLEDETKKRDALHKLAQVDPRKKQKESKDVEVELVTTDRIIAKIKEGLEILNSGDRDKMDALLQKMRKINKIADSMGHFFTNRQYYKPTDCSICHEALWDTKNHGMECTACKMICHKTCRPQVDTSCQDIIKLQTVAPRYFLAKDLQDRARWLVGLAYLRKEFEKNQRNSDGISGTPDKRMSSYVEQPSSKRMSGIFSLQGNVIPRKPTINEKN